jgi:hypothetical protein
VSAIPIDKFPQSGFFYAQNCPKPLYTFFFQQVKKQTADNELLLHKKTLETSEHGNTETQNIKNTENISKTKKHEGA